MVKLLIDTNVIIDLARGNETVISKVNALLQTTSLYISTISVMEVLAGARRSPFGFWLLESRNNWVVHSFADGIFQWSLSIELGKIPGTIFKRFSSSANQVSIHEPFSRMKGLEFFDGF